MFEKIKKIFTFKKEEEEIKVEKEVVICVHGFGTKRDSEYDNFKIYNNDKFNFKTFPIFEINAEDNNPVIWIRRCEGMVESYINAGYKVSLIGFSMGGVLASHLASKYPIEKLFLIAPAFDYLNLSNIVSSAMNYLRNPSTSEVFSLPTSFTTTFMEVIRMCKEDIANVDCPICMIHGDKDEVIPLRSSINAYDKIKHDKKKLFIIHKGKHQLMFHDNSSWDAWQIYNLFMDDKIVTNEHEKPDPIEMVEEEIQIEN